MKNKITGESHNDFPFKLSAMKTKESIVIKSAVELFSKHGIKVITMDDIASHGGMSKRTIYEVMGNKGQLVAKTLSHIQEIDMQIIKHSGMQKQNAIEEMIFFNKHVNQWVKEFSPLLEADLKKHYPATFKEMNIIREQRLYDILYANMQKGKQENVYRDNMDADIIARIFISRLSNFSHNEVITQEYLTSHHFYNEVFMYHMQGILNDKGRAVFHEKYEGTVLHDKPVYSYSFIPGNN